jgi:hypothetical protein
VTLIRQTKATVGLALGAMLALGALAAPASARWNGNGQWQQDNRQYEQHYYGYHYQPPPVVYATPYNYGYQPPPVYYDNTPGISIRLF